MHEEVLKVRLETLGADHVDVAKTRFAFFQTLTFVLHIATLHNVTLQSTLELLNDDQGKPEEALAMFHEAFVVFDGSSQRAGGWDRLPRCSLGNIHRAR